VISWTRIIIVVYDNKTPGSRFQNRELELQVVVARPRLQSRVERFLCACALFILIFSSHVRAQQTEEDSGAVAVHASDGESAWPLNSVAKGELPETPSIRVGAQEQESSSKLPVNSLTPSNQLMPAAAKRDRFAFKSAFIQTFDVNLFFQIWRVAFDPGLRYNVAHKPFWHDYFSSFKGYDMTHWGDGDDFVVNDVGHPLEGAVFGRVFLQNSPKSQVIIGKNRQYWMSRLKAMGWAAAWSTQLELGPISETSVGNQGGFTYVPGCGTALSCLNNPAYHKPPATNTGWTDFVVTPLVGTAWILGEDTIDKYIVMPIAVNHRILGGRVSRSALEPSRSFAALFSGRFPWQLPTAENNFVSSTRTKPATIPEPDLYPPIGHWEIGTQYTNLSLPVLSNQCSSGACRKNLSGMGLNFDYNFTRAVAFDSLVNFMPGQQGSKAAFEGLFGVKLGARFNRFGVFGKVRPGLIYYQQAIPGGGDVMPNSLSRFVTDFGGVFEYYPQHNTILRIDAGTTLVRYLTNRSDDQRYPLGSHLSTQYWVTQGNPQFSTSYIVRF